MKITSDYGCLCLDNFDFDDFENNYRRAFNNLGDNTEVSLMISTSILGQITLSCLDD
jgi:hypothetical protein